MTNLRQRHWAVDIGFLAAGGFMSAALTGHNKGYWIAALLLAVGAIWWDRFNIKDEEIHDERNHTFEKATPRETDEEKDYFYP